MDIDLVLATLPTIRERLKSRWSTSEPVQRAQGSLHDGPGDEALALYRRATGQLTAVGGPSAPAHTLVEAAGRPDEGDEGLWVATLWVLVEEHGRGEVLRGVFERHFWLAQHRYGGLLPLLSWSEEDAADWARFIDEQSSNDFAASRALEPLERWAARHPLTAVNVVRRYGDLPLNAALRLLVGALNTDEGRVALAPVVGAWAAVDADQHPVFLAALPALVQARLVPREAVAGLLAPASHPDTPWSRVAPALHALVRFLEEGADPAFLHELDRLVLSPRPEVQRTLARLITSSGVQEVQARAEPLLHAATAPGTSGSGTLDAMDLLLAQVADWNLPAVEPILAQWLERHPEDQITDEFGRGRFHLTFDRIAQRHPTYWTAVATRWLLGSVRLARAAHRLLDAGQPTGLDLGSLETLNDGTFSTLVNRVMAGQHDGDRTLTLLHSLEPHARGAARRTLLHAAGTELAIDYPGACQQFLERVGPPDARGVLATAVAETLNDYYPPREHRPALREFQPPPERYRRFQTLQHRRYQAALRAGEEDRSSLVSLLARRVAVARGDAWVFAREDGPPGEPSPFSRYDHSVEVARTAILDPEGHTLRELRRLGLIEEKL